MYNIWKKLQRGIPALWRGVAPQDELKVGDMRMSGEEGKECLRVGVSDANVREGWVGGVVNESGRLVECE